MPKQSKNGKRKEPDLWIAPRNNLKEPATRTLWEYSPDDVPSANRILELADIALRLKKTGSKRKRQPITRP